MSEARARFEAGSGHYAARRFREAIREFELANSAVPSADLAYNIARCHEQLDELPEAADYYERYLHEKIDPPDRAEVESKIAWLKEQIEARRLARRSRSSKGLLQIAVTPSGAAVRVDGRSVGQAPLRAPLELAPGSHRIDASAEGRQDWVSRVDVRAGDTTHSVVDLRPSTRHEAVRGKRLWTFVTAGTAAACAVGGIILGIGAQSTMADAQHRLDDGDVNGAHGLEDDAHSQADKADLLFGGAIVLGVTAVILYFVEGSAVGTETTVASR